MSSSSSDEVPLREARDLYEAVTGFANTYGTYREHAVFFGTVWLGAEVRAHKDPRGRWMVKHSELQRGLKSDRRRRAREVQVGADYQNHILHGKKGERVRTDSGFSYERRGPFHVRYDENVHPWKGDGVSWICNTCWRKADEEHGYDYCLRCDDLKPSGPSHDCTLSAVLCEVCGVRMIIEADPSVYRAPRTAPG